MNMARTFEEIRDDVARRWGSASAELFRKDHEAQAAARCRTCEGEQTCWSYNMWRQKGTGTFVPHLHCIALIDDKEFEETAVKIREYFAGEAGPSMTLAELRIGKGTA